MKGRVVVCKEYGKPFVIEEYEVPEPAPGAVILRMTQAGVCGSDLHTWRGDQTQQNLPLPPTGRAMGHEGTGVVEILGEGVETDSAGAPSRTATTPPPECGRTSPPPTPITCTCQTDIPSSRCRTSWTTISWGR